MTSQARGQQGPLDLIVVEDSVIDAELEGDALREAGQIAEVRRVEDEPAFRAALDERLPDAILSDWTLPNFSGRRALEIANERCPDVPFIFVSGTISEPSVLEALRQGARDYVYKHQLQHLGSTLLRAVNEARTLRSLRESEEKYRRLFENSHDALLVVLPPSWCVIDANQAALQMFGFNGKADFTGRNLCDVSPERQPDGRFSSEKVQEILAVVLREGSRSFEWEHRRMNGEMFAAEIMLTRVEVRGQVSVQATVRDISERKRAEDALKRSEKFVEDILSSVDEALIVVDREYRIISANRAYCEQTGKKLESILGNHCYEISHHATRPCREPEYVCGCKLTFDAGEPSVNVHTLTDDAGRQRQVEIKTFAMKNESGGVTSIIEVMNDITEKTALESQLRHAQKMEAVGTLAGGIAHDFNNILNVIIGFGSMVMDRIGDDPLSREQMNEVLTAANRAAILTKKLLVFSRKQVVEVRPVNINELTLGLQKMLVRMISESIEFDLDLADGPLIVLADAGQIEQVLMNLASNAKDAMPEGGRLTICTGLQELDNEYVAAYGYGNPGMHVMITVADTGQGIDAETQKKIFEPFFTTKGIGEGTGLGLAISYGIMRQHSGYIKVYSEIGKGTTFKLWLPVFKDTAEKKPEAETLAYPKGGTETILVAEDDASLRKLSRIVLESSGYRVITAEDGEDAVTKFMENREKINLVMLDMIMPKKNGREVGEVIREVNPLIKILFASGYTMDIIKTGELTESGFDFLLKPVVPRDLLKKVREVLDN